MSSKKKREDFWEQHEQNVELQQRAKEKIQTDKSKLWKKACSEYLLVNPVCQDCAKRKYKNIAEHVAHIQSPGTSQVLFWDINNWQALCDSCYQRVQSNTELNILNPIPKAVLGTLYTVK